MSSFDRAFWTVESIQPTLDVSKSYMATFRTMQPPRDNALFYHPTDVLMTWDVARHTLAFARDDGALSVWRNEEPDVVYTSRVVSQRSICYIACCGFQTILTVDTDSNLLIFEYNKRAMRIPGYAFSNVLAARSRGVELKIELITNDACYGEIFFAKNYTKAAKLRLVPLTRGSNIVSRVSLNPTNRNTVAMAIDNALLLSVFPDDSDEWGIDVSNFHSCRQPTAIKCIAWSNDGRRVITGGESGHVFYHRLIRLRQSSQDATTRYKQNNDDPDTISFEDHSCEPGPHKEICHILEHIMKDEDKHQDEALSSIMMTKHDAEIVSIVWREDDHVVAVVSSDGIVSVWDTRESPKKGYETTSICSSPRHPKLMKLFNQTHVLSVDWTTGSHDRIYPMLVMASSDTLYVLTCDWSTDETGDILAFHCVDKIELPFGYNAHPIVKCHPEDPHLIAIMSAFDMCVYRVDDWKNRKKRKKAPILVQDKL